MAYAHAGTFFAAFQRWTYFQCRHCDRVPSFYRSRSNIRTRCLSTTGNRNTSACYNHDFTNESLRDTQNELEAPPIVYVQRHDPRSLVDVLAMNSQKDTSDTLRGLMREMPHSVVVVTACHEMDGPLKPVPNPEEDGVFTRTSSLLSPYYRQFCGATISSMTTVTLGPPSIVSFNLKIPSRTLSGILKHKEFNINLLYATPSGAEVANAFIDHNHAEGFKTIAEGERWVGLIKSRKAKVPTIQGAGVRANLLCHVLPDKCIEVGDHMIVVAQVGGIDSSHEVSEIRSCLLYSDGKYKTHGEPLPLSSPNLRSKLVPGPSDIQHSDMNQVQFGNSLNELTKWYQQTLQQLKLYFPESCKNIAIQTQRIPEPDRFYIRVVMLNELACESAELSPSELELLAQRRLRRNSDSTRERRLSFESETEIESKIKIERAKLLSRLAIRVTPEIEEHAGLLRRITEKREEEEHRLMELETGGPLRMRKVPVPRKSVVSKILHDRYAEDLEKSRHDGKSVTDGLDTERPPKIGEKPIEEDGKTPWWYI